LLEKGGGDSVLRGVRKRDHYTGKGFFGVEEGGGSVREKGKTAGRIENEQGENRKFTSRKDRTKKKSEVNKNYQKEKVGKRGLTSLGGGGVYFENKNKYHKKTKKNATNEREKTLEKSGGL